MRILLRLLLGCVLAGAASVPALAVRTPVRLHELSVRRFVDGAAGQPMAESGLLDSVGRFKRASLTPVLSSVTVPPEAMNRYLITYDAWLAYDGLGPNAVDNFGIDESGGGFRIGERYYYPVLPSTNPVLDLGDAVNLSTRAIVTPGAEPMIGGFVIDGQHRWVLIRAVGPSLSQFDVPAPLADPYLVVYKSGSQVFQLFNDDWQQRHDAARIVTVADQVGAFPLLPGSKDAAYLVELEPGGYTFHVSSDTGAPGTVLLEVYVVPN